MLSRDQTVPHDHRQALFISNLEPRYMSRSLWVATYVKDGIIKFLDGFGMPPFHELVNHARRENLKLLHQNNQVQNVNTTTCGYFRFYFKNEMSKGKIYYHI